MALTRITSGGIAEGVKIVFDSNNTPASPALRFNNPDDTGTGIYQPADNELAISTAGQPRIIFKSDGKILAGDGTILGGTNPNFEGAENITLYVNQSDKNATDVSDNDGGNLNRPFKTIERALLEAAKRSYKANPSAVAVTALEVGKAYTITNVGNTDFVSIGASSNTVGVSFIANALGTGTGTVTLNNDKFEAFTIMVLPGQYEIDNRPGYDITTNPLVAGTSTTIDAEPFRFNPRNGGVIVPRGTSIVGYDLRKTVIRPKYVPAPFSTEGSLAGDGYVLSHVMYDGANMIEKNRGYIQEQTKLYLQANQTAYQSGLTDAQKALCIRDIGYFIDGIVSDLRQGGNENTFNNAEYYIDGNGYRNQFMKSNDTDVSQEIAATVAAFNHVVSIMRFITKSYNDSITTYSEITTGKTINRTQFTAGNGYVSDGDCSTVVNAVATLGAIATGILNNPDDYTREAVTVTLVGGGTSTVKLRKTQGVFKQTSIFKVTGGCYFWQMTFKDAIANLEKPIYNSATFDSNGIPTFSTTTDAKYSHHKVVAFTYADQRTTDGELDQYYKKIDAWQGRTSDLSQVRPEEFTIVGDGSKNSTIDTVNSCSPYIFNCSLRSTFGMCGMHTDGSKVAENSFKSMVVAQFTGISLQKDKNVFIQPKDPQGDTNVTPAPNNTTQYNDDVESTANPPIFADPDAQYKPECRHFHIKASNGGFIQVVSVFAVGYADQFLAETGGDMSITNSNSNFGQISLRAKGSQFNAFAPASQGRITAIVPPRGISTSVTDVSFYNIDANSTWRSVGAISEEFTTGLESSLAGFQSSKYFKLYLEISGGLTEDNIPELVIDSIDHATGNVVTKRFLTYGTSNQYALFRDYYQATGVTPEANRYVSLDLEDSAGGATSFKAKVKLFDSIPDEDNPKNPDGSAKTKNSERVGYFWDEDSKTVYLKLDFADAETDKFLKDFIFSFNEEKSFDFVTTFNSSDGSASTTLQEVTKKILRYKTGFPSTLIVKKYSDTRTSSPGDFLWKVEYTIPKYISSNVIPKAPEKRFIIKGTRAGNGEDGVPYSDYRFMVWDVEELTAWEKDVRDGVYYLTVVRADVNKFVDSKSNTPSQIVRRPTGITSGNQFACTFIEEVNNFDKDTKLFTNVNYLYPSVNEEGADYDTKRIWNSPQADSRVLVESLGNNDEGTRIKDISVPNYRRYRANDATTPYKDVPSLYSVTAESVHRLVQALDLRYITSSNAMATTGGGPDNSGRVFVASVSPWDARSSSSALGYTSNTAYNVYSTTYRFGRGNDGQLSAGIVTTESDKVAEYNLFGINLDGFARRIPVTSPGYTVSTNTLNDSSPSNTVGLTFAPVLPLYRPSILRASSHTWEYIGLGSGNYSTGFPNLQTRVLKVYEQFIAQGYENSGGFIASSGTNSAGDFYIGNQIIQAGGTSTVTLNVPKLRRSSESNYLDIENIENRISNAVVNVTATTGGTSNANQSALKALSNFFNITKLTVSDKANINNLIVGERLYIDRAEINNSTFFPEGNTNAYGFVKAAKPEKTGFISTDTNDKLYVSPKYLDAWRVKRQLISAQAVTLDNNRVYIQPYLQNSIDSYKSVNGKKVADAIVFTDTQVNDVTWQENAVIKLTFSESSGIPSFGKIDIQMRLNGLDVNDFYIDGTGEKVYFNPIINIPLQYQEIDYTDNTAIISNYQNGIPLITYLKSYCGSGEYTSIVKNYPSILSTGGTFGVDASEGDIKYLSAKLAANYTNTNDINVLNSTTYDEIQVSLTADEYAQWPSRGCVSLRQAPKGGTYTVATFAYYKVSHNAGTNVAVFKLTKNNGDGTNTAGASATFASDYDNLYPGIDSKNVFFTGCSTLVFSSDRWASEAPFIPPLDPTKGVVEEVNIEDAILYKVAEKSVPIAVELDTDYFDKNLPNPYSSKALGVNIQERRAVKKFSPLFSFAQAKQWAENSGFNSSDELELLMKPGYYKLDGTQFPCSVRINGTGVADSSVFAGKERTRTSAGRMGGYLEDTVKRGDSIYLYRSPSFGAQYGTGNDAFNVNVEGGLGANGSFNLNNVHFLGLNEAITKSEIPDSIYSSDAILQNARRIVRRAYYIKNKIKSTLAINTINSAGVDGAIEVIADVTSGTGVKAILVPSINSGDSVNATADNANYYELNSASWSNSRYMVVVLKSSDFTAEQFDRMRKYIIPGTTMYWLAENGKVIKLSDETTTENLSKSTKVLSVRRKNANLNTEELHVLISVYRTGGTNNGNLSAYTNPVEDLDLEGYTTGKKKLVFLNEDGAEFTTLAYNWCLETRRTYLPKGFMHEGGYQPAIIKTVTGGGTAGTKTITLNNVETVLQGDKIVALDSTGANLIPVGTRVDGIVGNTLTLTDNITTTIPVGSFVSFTQYDLFGDEIPKYDIPEIYGIVRGSEEGYISLVIDRNPNYEIDNTINPYPFGAGSFSEYPTQLIQLKNTPTSVTTEYGAAEDVAIATNRKKSLPLRRNGFTETRYVVIDIAPREFGSIPPGFASNPDAASSIDSFIENAGISKTILTAFANYDNTTLQFGGGVGKGFVEPTITVNINIPANSFVAGSNDIQTAINAALTSAGSFTNTRSYNSRLSATLVSTTGGTLSNLYLNASINTSTGAITAITAYNFDNNQPVTINGTFKIQVTDGRGYILSQTGRTVSLSDNQLSADDFKIVAKQNLLSAISATPDTTGSGSSPYLDYVGKKTTGPGAGVDDDPLTAKGKRIFLSWPYAYRALRRRFPSAGFPVNGNYQSSLITVNALPGSDFTLNLTGVTIGAQSPASEAANTFGGGYRGGLIKCRGAKLTLNGTRFRGNLSLDWTGLFSGNSSRAGGSFIAGHSIEMFQMEDQNSFDQMGGSSPAYSISTSPIDEEFRTLSEYNPKSNIYLEPSKDPYGRLTDGDARTFPITTLQAIRRFNKSESSVTPWTGASAIAPGGLLTKVALNERYQTPYKIYYDAPNGAPTSDYIPTAAGNTSAVLLRWNDGSATITDDAQLSMPTSLVSYAQLEGKTLSFFYAANESGEDIIRNIFVGRNATKFVKFDNIETTYATATRVFTYGDTFHINPSTGVVTKGGNYKFAKIQYSGSFAVLSKAAGTKIDLNVNYLSSIRYNYVATTTSRYQKTIVGTNSRLILSQDDNVIRYSEPANLSISNIDSTFTIANATRATIYELKNITRDTAVSGKVVLSTNSSGKLTSLDILSFGSGHIKNDVFAIYNGATKISNTFTMTVRENYTEETLELFENGEFKVILPKNCFILNSIENPGAAVNLKSEILKAKTIFKPGGYILYNNIYYKIAVNNPTTNSPYLGVYRYINETNTSDVRADIVVMLEDDEYTITYPVNTRFDVFDYDNILDYWPTTGRITIGNRETCDFEKAGNSSDPKGYELRLTRSMTKYWPHYIRDWEGLDPNNATDATVTVDSVIPTTITLADPVDVTCYGLKRFNSGGTGNNIESVTYGGSSTYVTPTGIVANKVAKISISSTTDAQGLLADFEKLSIGQTVTIPYRDISKPDIAGRSATNWNSVNIVVGDQQYTPGSSISTNREGDRRISGSISFRNAAAKRVYYKYTYNIHATNTHDTEIYDYVNSLSSAILSSGRDSSVDEIHPAGFRRWGYLGVRNSQTATAGQKAITIGSEFARSMQRISSYATFTATFTDVAVNPELDPFEKIMTVSAVSVGAITKGQPIYATLSGSHPSGTYGSLIGYVVGMNGDSFIKGTGVDYEDSQPLTGNGGAGTYRVLLVESPPSLTTNMTVYGRRNSTDYLYYAPNNCCWARTVDYKVVNSDNTTTVYLNDNLVDPLPGNSPIGDGDDFTPSVPAGSNVIFYYNGYYDNSIILTLDKPLAKAIPEGTIFNIAPTPDYGYDDSYGHPGKGENNSFLFKSRILDLEKDGTNGKINVYLTDPFPIANWQRNSSGTLLLDDSTASSPIKTFGMMYINHGGWTYPKTGGSAFRANNVKLAGNPLDPDVFSSEIYLPNRSGRVRAGDQITYTWEDIYRIQSTTDINCRITASSTTSKEISIVAPATGIDESEFVQQVILPGYIIYTSDGTEIGTVASVSATTITLVENCKTTTTTNANWKFTTTGNTYTYTSQIFTVDPPSADTGNAYYGYSKCTISSSPTHILHNGYRESFRPNWYTIQDVFVSHRLGNFTNDGPIARKFIYSDTGVKLTFGEYKIWYENYGNYIRANENSTGQPMSGRQGWVGNFGLSATGQRTIGIQLNGASSLQLGRQYNRSIWLAAVPVHAKWESASYATYMIQSDSGSTIENNYAPATLTNYDGAGRYAFSVLNHTVLSSGSVYASHNTGDYSSYGGESYDTKQYQFISTNTKLRYSLQNGTVSNTGSVAGGATSRLAEQFAINRVINYKPCISTTFAAQKPSLGISITSGTSTISGTNIALTLLPGDVVYSGQTPSTNNFVGVVRSRGANDDQVTLSQPYTGTGFSGNTTWSYISPRVMHSTAAGAGVVAGQSLIFSGDSATDVTPTNVGTLGYNVIGNNKPGFNRYNVRFNIDRRVYNQSTLINTYTNIKPVESYNVAERVIDIKFGDLATYVTPLMNIEVTRFNAKTHVETSISVVGSSLHI